jgi:glycosyltransferase involved in cell wall biosynthesis
VIVHVTDCFHPRLGGIETQVGDLARAQLEGGESVHVVTATPANDEAGEVDHGYPVHRVVTRLPWDLPVHPRAGVHLGRLFRQLRPDAVHIHLGSVSPFAWSAMAQALQCDLPTVATVHSMWGAASRGMYRWLDRVIDWSRGPIVTTVSTASADLIMKTAPAVPVVVVPNGIAPQAWRQAPCRDRAEDDVRIVAVGRLSARKQPVVLLKALHAARKRIDSRLTIRATVAGDGPALPLMRAYIHTHSMADWVHLAGRLDRDSVRSLLSSADIFVNPAVRESFGIAALEARTAGLPVIARTGNGVSDFVRHAEQGLLCASTDELVDAIVRLVEDTETRQRIRDHNRSTDPAGCAWPAVVSEFARCYRRAANRMSHVDSHAEPPGVPRQMVDRPAPRWPSPRPPTLPEASADV